VQKADVPHDVNGNAAEGCSPKRKGRAENAAAQLAKAHFDLECEAEKVRDLYMALHGGGTK
jgi:hypothetical protein